MHAYAFWLEKVYHICRNGQDRCPGLTGHAVNAKSRLQGLSFRKDAGGSTRGSYRHLRLKRLGDAQLWCVLVRRLCMRAWSGKLPQPLTQHALKLASTLQAVLLLSLMMKR